MITIYGQHDDRTLGQMDRCMRTGSAVQGVLCADGHLGYAHPIGGVVAYENDISISGVGFDIACGNMAVRLDARYADLASRTDVILDDITSAISFGVGQKNAVAIDHELTHLHEHRHREFSGLPSFCCLEKWFLRWRSTGGHAGDPYAAIQAAFDRLS